MLGSEFRGKSAPIPLTHLAGHRAGRAFFSGLDRRASPVLLFRAAGARNVQVDADHVEPFAVLPVTAPSGAGGMDGIRDGISGDDGGTLAAHRASRPRAPESAAPPHVGRHETRRPGATSPGHPRSSPASQRKPCFPGGAWRSPLSPRYCGGPDFFRASLAARLEIFQCQRAC